MKISPTTMSVLGDLFLKRYGDLINLSKSGQLALRKMLEDHLMRIEWENELPIRVYPFIERDRNRLIAIDPSIKFGRPVLIHKGVSTSIIVDRIDAGESPEEVAEDYDLDHSEVEMVILYERAA